MALLCVILYIGYLTSERGTYLKGFMMYTDKNYQTKKELKADVVAGKKITYYQPGPFGGNEPKDGTFCVEGPHYPQPHKWYATCTAKDGIIIGVK